jgi:hypothetical protein
VAIFQIIVESDTLGRHPRHFPIGKPRQHRDSGRQAPVSQIEQRKVSFDFAGLLINVRIF